MPVYDYLCETCGPFAAMQPMDRYRDPCDCPECGAVAPRVLLTAPRLAMVDSATRTAHETNERSAHAPHLASHHGHVHSHDHSHRAGGSISKQLRTHDNGAKSFPGKRPWMISH